MFGWTGGDVEYKIGLILLGISSVLLGICSTTCEICSCSVVNPETVDISGVWSDNLLTLAVYTKIKNLKNWVLHSIQLFKNE